MFVKLGLSTTLTIFTRNQGPIAEAEARRKKAAAAFLEKQAQVIAGSERAMALYVAALKELAEADQSLRKLQDAHLQMMEQAVRLGEEDRLGLNGVQIRRSIVARAKLDAVARPQRAPGQPQDPVQQPPGPANEL